MRSNARLRVRTRPTGEISVPNVRIGLIWSAEPTSACAAPMRPPRRRYSSVSRQNQMSSRSRVPWIAAHHRVGVLARLGRARGRDDEAAEPAGAGRAVDDLHARAVLLLHHRPASRPLSQVPERPSAMCTETMSCPASASGSYTAQEVADRRLRGHRQRRRLLQPHVEEVEVVVGRLGPQVAVPAHVQRHLPDAPPLDEVGRQVRGAVGDDRDAHLTDATKPRTSPRAPSTRRRARTRRAPCTRSSTAGSRSRSPSGTRASRTGGCRRSRGGSRR